MTDLNGAWMETFWERNWAVAKELGDPVPPNLPKPVSEHSVPIYCSEARQRAVDRGFKCTCGCTEMLRAQQRIIKRDRNITRKQELAVMGWVKPRRNSAAWDESKKIIQDYHTKEDE